MERERIEKEVKKNFPSCRYPIKLWTGERYDELKWVEEVHVDGKVIKHEKYQFDSTPKMFRPLQLFPPSNNYVFEIFFVGNKQKFYSKLLKNEKAILIALGNRIANFKLSSVLILNFICLSLFIIRIFIRFNVYRMRFPYIQHFMVIRFEKLMVEVSLSKMLQIVINN